MPGLDGTGPMGMGHMTGRGMGMCADPAAPIYMGGGYGRGRGYRRMYYMTGMPRWARYGAWDYYPEVPVADEKEALQKEASVLEQQLTRIRERINSLDNEKKD